MITPFVLKRTKEDVASDLPEKTETILYCEMGKEQRKVYETVQKKYKKEILKKIEKEGLNKSGFLILRLKWAAIVDQKVRELGHGERCRVFAEDARAALPRFVEACLCRVFIQFPDPWWKKRHKKRRLTSDSVFDDVTRLLVDHGELFIQTDVEERIDSFAAIADAHPDLVPFGSEARVSENPYGARTPREHRAIRDGLPIYRLRYRRRARNASGSPPSRPA
jgi:tRNA G46 methylase TrmB